MNYEKITQGKNTDVFAEAEYKYNAPHNFKVLDKEGNVVASIHFQEGPIKEVGINGVANEDLIAMVVKRLQCFQKSEFSCRENACAITKLEEALMWLEKRTKEREQRGVEGTNKI